MQGIFIGTFLIGLREGLEATLIVSIVGAFLRRNGRSIRPMLVGVAAAVLLSLAVGAGLDLLSSSLPQRQQEMLETVIGAAAVVFVTTMIIWMNRHAFALKGELESEAAQAISSGGSFALAVMAFLAVLKEGFETAVFLLAAAQATHGSRWVALVGGLAGIAVAIAIGIGIYFGGLKLNLGRFFRITGVFLIFIAAGLVMSTLRTAHEAGWIDVGQQRVFDFSSWMPARSVVGALVTGMFGIQSDPRVIEVLGWLLYAVPVLVVFLWPQRYALTGRLRRRVLLPSAAVLAVTAAALAVLIPVEPGPAPGATRQVALTSGGTATVTLSPAAGGTRAIQVGDGLPIVLTAAGRDSTAGVDTELWQAKVPADPGVRTPTVTLAGLAELTGGRVPVGLGSSRAPGPFAATWSATTSYFVSAHGDTLVSAHADGNRVAVLRGGGLSTDKTVSLGALPTDWATLPAEDASVGNTITQLTADRAERMLWRRWLPGFLVVAAAAATAMAFRSCRDLPTHPERHHHDEPTPKQDTVT
ncbi:FTR1 family protein [Mycolicibacterium canariasense]|nr:FTR1 family protein [Mycolicibacterium canariasense]ORV14932.1 high-affinity Fe2+/Pb2+ permease [Mycolicibacterium canariasense]